MPEYRVWMKYTIVQVFENVLADSEEEAIEIVKSGQLETAHEDEWLEHCNAEEEEERARRLELGL